MDEKDSHKFTPAEIAIGTVVAVTIAYSAYNLGRIGVDWAREGVRTIKSKTSNEK